MTGKSAENSLSMTVNILRHSEGSARRICIRLFLKYNRCHSELSWISFTKNSRSFRNRSHSLCFSLLRVYVHFVHIRHLSKNNSQDCFSRQSGNPRLNHLAINVPTSYFHRLLVAVRMTSHSARLSQKKAARGGCQTWGGCKSFLLHFFFSSFIFFSLSFLS